MNNFLKTILTFCFLSVFNFALAQQLISGSVTDVDGQLSQEQQFKLKELIYLHQLILMVIFQSQLITEIFWLQVMWALIPSNQVLHPLLLTLL